MSRMKAGTPERITIHCTDTTNGLSASISVIAADHIQKFGTIGYHLIIQPDGEVCKTKPLNHKGAHVKGHNTGNIGIALVGKDKFTHAQYEALRNQLDSLHMTFDIDCHEIWCHSEWDTAKEQGKTCPNIRIANLICWYVLDDLEAIEENLIKDKKSGYP